MTSPFLGKSPADLLAMVQNGSLSDPELDALCAKYCNGLRVNWGVTSWTHEVPIVGQENLYPLRAHRSVAIPSYTSDPREAIRLLVKYRLNVQWGQDFPNLSKRTLCVLKSLNPDSPIGVIPLIPGVSDKDLLELVCRASAEAAVTCELTRTIEGDK